MTELGGGAAAATGTVSGAAEAGRNRDWNIRIPGREFFGKQPHGTKRGTGAADHQSFCRDRVAESEQQRKRDCTGASRASKPHTHWFHVRPIIQMGDRVIARALRCISIAASTAVLV